MPNATDNALQTTSSRDVVYGCCCHQLCGSVTLYFRLCKHLEHRVTWYARGRITDICVRTFFPFLKKKKIKKNNRDKPKEDLPYSSQTVSRSLSIYISCSTFCTEFVFIYQTDCYGVISSEYKDKCNSINCPSFSSWKEWRLWSS